MDKSVKEEALLEAPEEPVRLTSHSDSGGEKLIPAHTGAGGKKAPKSLIIVLITITVLWVVGLASYIFVNQIQNQVPAQPENSQVDENTMIPTEITTAPEDGMVACTMDARLCPDGSSVGREGPNCEFPKCPGE